MLRRMYCIYDFKAEAPVSQVFQCYSTDADATRMFSAVVLNPASGLLHQHPADFGLLFIGTISFDNLSFESNPTARAPITTGDACVRAAERARAQVPADGAELSVVD